ncbi:hypothetical protein OIE13_28955 [Streptosporangium sp. NBC_01810]|uniref:hypothetical protein n=1 Tax=Streptosporangium sp. NBC_01810 TaxID=2975951 RepID=UPI002DDAEDDA|nr:hypothetical protein [Streptosporangium sp. NBC_01810]WSA24928.1 hypothetical protein OIE13_28955 [Streptosporangium sp. NBC_01810]
MTMPAGEATLGEVARTLDRFERSTNARLAEVAASISLMVTRDLYEAHRAAMLDDIAQLRSELKTERECKAADRRMVTAALISAALISAALSLVVAIVAAALLVAFRLNS